jgi:hypothetical protein
MIAEFFVTAYEQMLDSFINNPIAQAIGCLSLLLSLTSFQMRKRRTVLFFQMLASISCAISLIMLGGIAGGILDLIAFSRTLVFSLSDRYKWAGSRVCLFTYFAVIIACGILTWEPGSIATLFAISGTLLSTLALYMKNEQRLRIISLFSGPCWIVYSLIYSSCFGILNEIIAMTSIIIALVRMRESKHDNPSSNR